MIVEKNILTSLEFDKISQLAQAYCIGAPARLYFDNIRFFTDIDRLELILTRVQEMKNSFLSDDILIINHYEDITQILKDLKIKAFVLPVEALQQINNIIKGVLHIKEYFKGENRQLYPALALLSDKIIIPDEIVSIIDKVLDENGEIKTTASPQLHAIAKTIRSKKIEINKVFNSIVSELKSRNLLSDTLETFRNGRRVLTLPVENKRKIRGIIHDESATGKTVYIEPEAIIELNNDLFDLEVEYKKEVYKILKNLSDQLRPFAEDIKAGFQIITGYDVIAAKAKFAIKLNASKPFLHPVPLLHFENACHPLLLLRNDETGDKTIPFDMKLSKGNRIIIISGPNAGGKSITLKAVGLLQLMTQAGMLIPANEQSKIGVFNKIFTDIGDQQSVENDLSTYSSRLKNMKEILEHADKNSLVLIDEFGSGTDPKIGGAIAEAILYELNKIKVFAVITTHYSNLKVFAFKTKGIVNAAMQFDKKNIMPTYEFVLGKPGSSFAFEIAQNTGLSNKVLRYAGYKAGKNIKNIEELLVQLQEDKAELEEKLLQLKDKEFQLDKLIEKNKRLYDDLDFKKKKLKIQTKEQSLNHLNEQGKELRKLIKEIKAKNKLEEAKNLEKKLNLKKQETLKEVKTLHDEIHKSTKSDWENIKPGDYVKSKSGSFYGKVTKIHKNKAEIITGNISITVALHELVKSKKPIDFNNSVSINTKTYANKQKFDTTIDIRGYSMAEALDTLQDFFDNALLANAVLLKIVHGKGNGILRNAVKQVANEYKDIDELWHPPIEQGGDGITFVKLK